MRNTQADQKPQQLQELAKGRTGTDHVAPNRELPFPYVVRSACERDHAFVFHAWIESYKHDAPQGSWLHALPWRRYKPLQTAVIRHAVRMGVVTVACDPADPEHLLGFACGSVVSGTNVLHYVYVRPDRRRVGLGSVLAESIASVLGHALDECSHSTRAGQPFARSLSLSFNPLSSLSTESRTT